VLRNSLSKMDRVMWGFLEIKSRKEKEFFITTRVENILEIGRMTIFTEKVSLFFRQEIDIKENFKTHSNKERENIII